MSSEKMRIRGRRKRSLKARVQEVVKDFKNAAEAASALGIPRSRISELKKARWHPKGKALITIGSVALKRGLEDPLFFWEQAGLKREEIVSAVNQVAKDQIVRPGPGQFIAVPRAERTPDGVRELGCSISMPAELAPNPLSTYCFNFLSPYLAGPTVNAVVDTTGCDAEDLNAFWNRLVLALFEPDAASKAGGWPEGFALGMLYIDDQIRAVTGWVWHARLAPVSVRLDSAKPLYVGTWDDRFDVSNETLSDRVQREAAAAQERLVRELEPQFPVLPGEDFERWRLRAEEAFAGKNPPQALVEYDAEIIPLVGTEAQKIDRVRSSMRLYPGCKILGQVLAWWEGPYLSDAGDRDR